MKEFNIFNTPVTVNETVDGDKFLTARFDDEESPFYGEFLFDIDDQDELIPTAGIGNMVFVTAMKEYENYAQYWAQTHRIGA